MNTIKFSNSSRAWHTKAKNINLVADKSLKIVKGGSLLFFRSNVIVKNKSEYFENMGDSMGELKKEIINSIENTNDVKKLKSILIFIKTILNK